MKRRKFPCVLLAALAASRPMVMLLCIAFWDHNALHFKSFNSNPFYPVVISLNSPDNHESYIPIRPWMLLNTISRLNH